MHDSASLKLCITDAGSTLTPILYALVKFLGHELVQSALKEIWNAFNEWLEKNYGGWNEILKIAFDKGEQAAVSALEAVKDEIVIVCKESHKLLELVGTVSTKVCIGSVATKQAIKTAADLSVQQGIKQATTQVAVKLTTAQATKSITKEVVKATTIKGSTQTVIQATKLVAATPVAMSTAKTVAKSVANPISIVADVAQAGFEICGYKKVGKTVGATGNIVGGAVAGSIAGPPGAAVGAVVGLGIWMTGEVVGGLVKKAFGDGSTSGEQQDLEQMQTSSRESTNSDHDAFESEEPQSDEQTSEPTAAQVQQ